MEKAVFLRQILALRKKICYTKRMLAKYQGKRICVAISGGADSVALLHYLNALKGKYGYYLCAVHCEHGIRGEESREDMRFVEALCFKWGIGLFVFEGDCPARARKEKVSLETAARNFRYECFRSIIKKNKMDFIATAHHQNDEAETVLFRLARGTSLGGMSAMKEESGYLIRPFLRWSKADILGYIQENGLEYRQDKTNFELDATRNKIRLEVLPKLEEAVSGATENIARFSLLASEDDALLCELAQELITKKKGEYYISFSDKKPLFTRAALFALKGLGLEKDYTSTHLQSVFLLQYLERGARLDLPKNICAERLEHCIKLYIPTEEVFVPLGEEKDFSAKGFDGGRYEVIVSKSEDVGLENEWKTLRLDGNKIPKTAVFRFRKEGDFIRTFGGNTKTLKKFFNEKKLPVKERGYLPLIAERESGEVYAVCGVEIAESVKVDEGTENVLYISIRKKEKQNDG